MTGMQNRKLKTKEAVEVIWNLFANHESMKGTKETNIKKYITAANMHFPKVSAYDANN